MNVQEIDQLIYDTAVKNGMPNNLAKYIVAQAKFETGNYTQRNAKEHNNMFNYGYVPPNGSHWQVKNKWTVTGDDVGKLGWYLSIEDSVNEMTDWIKRRQTQGFPNLLNIVTPQQYAAVLKQFGYFTAPLATYSAGVTAWFKKLSVVKKASVFF